MEVVDIRAGEQQPSGSRSLGRTLLFVAAGLFLALALAELLLRGFKRGLADSGDFAALYAQTRAWWQGANPFEINSLIRVFGEAGGDPAVQPNQATTPGIFLPITFVPALPFALLPWQAAKLLWNVLVLALTLAIPWALLRLSGLSFRSPSGLLLCGFSLALAPLSTGLSKGQPAIAAIACLALGIAVGRGRRNDVAAGVLLGLGCCLKPQLIVPFLLLYVLDRRWRVLFAAIGVMAVCGGVALALLLRQNENWTAAWMHNVAASTTPSGMNSPLPQNPMRYQLINVQVLLASLVSQPSVLRAAMMLAGLALVLALGAALWWRYRRHREHGGEASTDLALLSVLSIVSVLIIYHRVYDAGLLVFALAWAAAMLGRGRRAEALTVMLPCAVFLVPGVPILEQLGSSGRVPPALRESFLWNAVVMPHQIWALLILLVIFIRVCRRSEEGSSPEESAAMGQNAARRKMRNV